MEVELFKHHKWDTKSGSFTVDILFVISWNSLAINHLNFTYPLILREVLLIFTLYLTSKLIRSLILFFCIWPSVRSCTNFLFKISVVIKNLTSLHELDLSYNNLDINHIEKGAFALPPNMTYFSIANNNLKTIPIDDILSSPKKLHVFDIRNNQFPHLTDELLSLILNGTTVLYDGEFLQHQNFWFFVCYFCCFFLYRSRLSIIMSGNFKTKWNALFVSWYLYKSGIFISWC